MRLIDADAISFRCSYGGMCMGDIEDCRSCVHSVCDYEDIQNIPTAYDVSKVVAELSEKSGTVRNMFGGSTRAIGLRTAIDIVKAGGVE